MASGGNQWQGPPRGDSWGISKMNAQNPADIMFFFQE
jgi:hypothetical protein